MAVRHGYAAVGIVHWIRTPVGLGFLDAGLGADSAVVPSVAVNRVTWRSLAEIIRPTTEQAVRALNRIEAQFTALRYFTLDGAGHESHEAQASRFAATSFAATATPTTKRYVSWSSAQTLPNGTSSGELESRAQPACIRIAVGGLQPTDR